MTNFTHDPNIAGSIKNGTARIEDYLVIDRRSDGAWIICTNDPGHRFMEEAQSTLKEWKAALGGQTFLPLVEASQEPDMLSICQKLGFDPTNHHNAAKCPYCNPQTEEKNDPPGNGLPFGIIDPDYARIFTQARIIAWGYGYACVMHGSFTRDLDLLLVPWTEQARDNHEQLMRLIAESCELRFSDGLEDIYKAKVDFTKKPNGRKACSLYFPRFGDRRWVDISITPIGT